MKKIFFCIVALIPILLIGDDWSSPISISGENSYLPHMALDSNGDGAAVWVKIKIKGEASVNNEQEVPQGDGITQLIAHRYKLQTQG